MIYKNSHTTSTKCQYQEAASKPKWWLLVKWNELNLIKHMNKNIVPTRTWKPWNPVATKNVDPYTESAIQNGASRYSNNCNRVKIIPKIIVTYNAFIDSFLSPSTILWWAQVIVAPELNKIAVLRRGIEKGFNALIPKGGPSSPLRIGLQILGK